MFLFGYRYHDSVLCVNKLRAIASFLVLATWLSCSIRCQLVMAGVFSPQKPIASLDTQGSSAPDSDDDSVCSWMESGGYEAPDCGITVDIPIFDDQQQFLWALLILEHESPQARSSSDDPIPPELPQSWQFSSRTALPARPPSFVS
jgi:hypothetical protein